MKLLPSLLALLGLAFTTSLAVAPGEAAGSAAAKVERQGPLEDFEALRERAEAHYARGSYALAREVYEGASALELTPDQAQWVAFRLADCAWRAAAKTNEADTTTLDRARVELEALATDPERVEDRSAIWAEANESLGDFHWSRRSSRDWWQGWTRYEKALSWWAASSDVDVARRRYLDIVFAAGLPAWETSPWNRGGYASSLPRDVLSNAAKIALEPKDRASASYLLGMHFSRQGQNLAVKGHAERAFRAVLELGKSVEWYDDALYQLANHLHHQGRAARNQNGDWIWEPDYVEALVLYRRLLREFRKGETHWYDRADAAVREITSPVVQVTLGQFFLPGSEVAYRLDWRNVDSVQLALYPTELARDVSVTQSNQDWLASVPLQRMEARKRWTHATKDDGRHRPGTATLTIDDEVQPGAYVLSARAGEQTARALVLVSDVALTTKATGERILAWLTDVMTGEPVAGGRLHLWQWTWQGGSWRLRERRADTGPDGTFLFELPETDNHSQFFLAASAADGTRQAYVQTGAQPSLQPSQEWRIYAYTDRSTYRPGDEVKWKVVARRWDGRSYSTPAKAKLAWFVADPRGADWKRGELELDDFGAAFGELVTDATMSLGEYAVRFLDSKGHHVGSATFFRLEEYELPEFEVRVTTPEDEDGRPRRFVLGEEVQVDVQADYYYGGPVADASVEVFVWQKPFWNVFPVEREFPWFHDETNRPGWWGGDGNQVSHQVLRTDAAGKARVVFETPFELSNDHEYTIEARVTDASRREISGRGSVRVTRTEYFVRVKAKHAIHRPGADVEVEVSARDANARPVACEGALEVTREVWTERWRSPDGKVVRREELPDRRPPAGWVSVQRGYEQEVVAKTRLATGADGEGRWRFRPDRPGTYRARWRSVDGHDADVTAETTVFVADEETRELGYLPGGIEILLDEDTLEVGQDALFLLAAPASGRWVLVTVEAETLQHHQVVRLDGSVKLVRIAMTEEHVPNVWLGAVSFADGQGFEAGVELIVPPASKFLDVAVTHDAEVREPGTEGALTVVVKDRSGEPVDVQLSVAVVDESLSYVQGDYAGDPRRFFYGRKRWRRVQTFGSQHHARYRKLAEIEDELRYVDRDGGDEFGIYDQAAKEEDGFSLGREGRRAGTERSDLALPSTAAGLEALGYQGEAQDKRIGEPGVAGPAGPGGAEPNVRVRSDFREVALWSAAVETGPDGTARLTFPYPDSTTRWKTTVRAFDRTTRVGGGEARSRTRQPLIARLQAPRFFVVGDEVTLSGNFNNDTETAMSVLASLEVEGLELLGLLAGGELVEDPSIRIEVPAGDQVRVDWRVRVGEPGQARLVLRGVGTETGDAVERSYPVFAHGIGAFVATSGRFDRGSIAFALELPAARAAGSTELVVQVTPSLAVTMLDALPYLAGYPYGCTEQTLSRFLPSAIVAKTLRDFGLSAEDAMTRVFGGIERDFVERTQPKGKQALEELGAMTDAGLARLYDFQHSDGGWSWWKHGDSDHFMTAYVLWGLSLARDAGLDVRTDVLENAARFLARELVEEEWSPDLQAWMLHTLAVHGAETGDPQSKEWMERAFANLWDARDGLNAYGRALLALSAHELGKSAEADVLADNLLDGAIVDRTPDTSIVQALDQRSRDYVLQTAHWGNDGIWQRWSDGGVEATAFVLRALVAIRPEHELVELAANWLVQNRRGAQWSNTRDTAISVLALNDYLARTGQLASPVAYEVKVNGRSLASVELAADELLRAPSRFPVDPSWIVDGANRIEIARTAGTGPLYFAAEASFFSLEEPVRARGNLLFVRRQYYRLAGRPTLLAGTVHDRVPLADGDRVTSGDRIQVVLTVEAKNDLEYLVFEDLKPAGFEAVQVKSGESMVARELKRSEIEARLIDGRLPRTADGSAFAAAYTQRSRSVHQELRDRKVALFVDKLADGFWELTYDLRAETPGSFHALPLLGHAMYVPEVRANGEEIRVVVEE